MSAAKRRCPCGWSLPQVRGDVVIDGDATAMRALEATLRQCTQRLDLYMVCPDCGREFGAQCQHAGVSASYYAEASPSERPN